MFIHFRKTEILNIENYHCYIHLYRATETVGEEVDQTATTEVVMVC